MLRHPRGLAQGLVQCTLQAVLVAFEKCQALARERNLGLKGDDPLVGQIAPV